MSDKKRVACFFTAGYTELYAMKMFMGKINADAEYIQLCPTKERRNKQDIQNRHVALRKSRHLDMIAQSGYTGDKLIEFIEEFIKTEKFKREQYDAILIEDDKDNRFLEMQPDGRGRVKIGDWLAYKEKVINYINTLYSNMPVIFFLAAPEVETWMIADWDNGFGSMFKKELGTDKNQYFNIVFRKYVNNEILKEYRTSIEEYGYFSGTYRKLSNEIQNGLKSVQFWGDDYASTACDLSYSKKLQGGNALERIEPAKVQSRCPIFFREAFYSLQGI